MQHLRSMSFVAVLLAISGCNPEQDFGPVRAEQRAVGSFESIEMQGDARLEIRVGAVTSVEVEGVDELLQNTKTVVENRTLVIDNRSHQRKWMKRVRPVHVRITLPQLVTMKINGGNDVRLRGFEGGESTFDIEGAAHVDARGRLDRLTINMQGAGFADFEDLVAGRATVTVQGVGSAYVHATDSLTATMNGVGTILYSGNPREVKTSMNGLGKVGRRGEREREQRDRKREPIDPDSLQPEYEEQRVDSEEPTIEV